MGKSTKEITLLAEELMFAWIKGWQEYYRCNIDDHPAIIEISKKCCNHLKLDIDKQEDFIRCTKALEAISFFCKYNNPWSSKNLRYINIGFQRLYNEMAASKRLARNKVGN